MRRGTAIQLTEVIERSVRLELAAALSITESSAGTLIAQADALVNRYPAVLDSLGGCPDHAAARDRAGGGVGWGGAGVPGPAARSRARAGRDAPVGTFRRKLRALVETVRAVTLKERHERALQQRRVVLEPAEDGMAWLHQYGPRGRGARDLRPAHRRRRRSSPRSPDETRTLDQLRADVFCDTPHRRRHRHPAARSPRHPRHRGRHRPGPRTARPDSDDGRRRRRDGGGCRPDLDDTGAGAVRRREAGGCGCSPTPRPGSCSPWAGTGTGHPRNCAGWSDGGPRPAWPPDATSPPPDVRSTTTSPGNTAATTALGNLGPFCKGHHTVKHHGDWRVEQIDGSGGAMLWTSPTGRQYRVDPERRVPAFIPTGADAPALVCTPPCRSARRRRDRFAERGTQSRGLSASSAGDRLTDDHHLRVEDPGERTLVVLGGLAFAHPVLVAADHLLDAVAELRELEGALRAGVAAGAPAVDDDGDVAGRARVGARSAICRYGMWMAPGTRPCAHASSPRTSTSTNGSPAFCAA